MQVTVENLSKNFAAFQGKVAALEGISFTIAPGEFYTLLGPSGCGKSTTMRCVAGLEQTDGGTIRIGDQVMAAPGVYVPPDRRPIGMVFQSYAIWPHMTVFNNVAFPLNHGRNKIPRSQRRDRVMEALSLVKMEGLADRPAPFLSGGQQQRVALARALVLKPQVLLLDEPLSNLDAKLREDLRIEIKDLTKRLGITTLYVTHDQLEALTMSDRIAVMQSGRILQEAAPKDLYLRPASDFIASFIGQVNFLHGRVVRAADDSGSGQIAAEGSDLRCPIPDGTAVGAPAMVVIRPENLALLRQPTGGTGNVLQGQVEKAIFIGEATECQIRVGGQLLRARARPAMNIQEGETVFLQFQPEDCVVLPADRTSIAATEAATEKEVK